jgi:hypothetical protein
MQTQEISSAQKTHFVKLVCDSIIEAVKMAGSQGAPAGHLYAAMMVHGFSLEQFEQIMWALVLVGELERRGQVYFVKAGSQ